MGTLHPLQRVPTVRDCSITSQTITLHLIEGISSVWVILVS